jgi:hypothetical protein
VATLSSAAFPVIVVNHAHVRAYVHTISRRAKAHAIDAR